MPVVHDANPKATESAPRQPSSTSDPSELVRDGVQPLLASGDARPHALSMLLSSVRHELGSPLQLIQGFAELLASGAYGELSEEQRSLLNHVLTASGELRNVVEACLELAELELIGVARASPAPLDLRTALVEALEHVQKQRGLLAQLQPGPPTALTRGRIERAPFQRAFEALLVALSAGDQKSFSVALEVVGEYAQISVVRSDRTPRAVLLPFDELTRERRITRNLVWFRLAACLFASQDGALSVAEQLDCAQVRLRISSTH